MSDSARRFYAGQGWSGLAPIEVVEAAAYDEMVRRAETAEASRHVPMWVRDDLSARIAKLEAAAREVVKFYRRGALEQQTVDSLAVLLERGDHE